MPWPRRQGVDSFVNDDRLGSYSFDGRNAGGWNMPLGLVVLGCSRRVGLKYRFASRCGGRILARHVPNPLWPWRALLTALIAVTVGMIRAGR